MRLFKDALQSMFPSKDDVQIWDCDPLLVVDDSGAVAYSRRTDVEWHPSEGGQGHLFCLTAHNGWSPDLEIKTRLVMDTAIGPIYATGVSFRPGVTIQGHDNDGKGFTWYINGAADQYLTTDIGNVPPYDEASEI